MRRIFVKPTLRRYDLCVKENIVGSWDPTDGTARFDFQFIHYSTDGVTVLYSNSTTPNGCFEMLNNYYSTAEHMANEDVFIIWYSHILETQINSGKHEGYSDFIKKCSLSPTPTPSA